MIVKPVNANDKDTHTHTHRQTLSILIFGILTWFGGCLPALLDGEEPDTSLSDEAEIEIIRLKLRVWRHKLCLTLAVTHGAHSDNNKPVHL